MSWIQTLLGPLPGTGFVPKKLSAAEILLRGNQQRKDNARQSVLDCFSHERWTSSAPIAKLIGRSPQAVRKQIARLVAEGLLRRRASGVGHRLEWRRIDAVPTVRREIEGATHPRDSEDQAVSSMLVEVVVIRDTSARIAQEEVK